MATTSSGRSRRRSLWLAGAVAITATALFRLTDSGTGSVTVAPPRATPVAADPQVLPFPRAAAADTLATSMSAEELERTLAEAAPGTADLVIEKGLTTWLTDDPAAAAAFAGQQTEPFLREVALRTIANRWAEIDAQAAARWAESLADTGERDRAIEQAALSIARADPRAALELLSRRGGDSKRDTASGGVLTTWAHLDFDAALSWVEAQPPGETRDDIVERLVVLRAGRDPRASMSLADRLITDEETRRDAWAALSQRWASREPERVREWASSADAGARRRIEAELALATAAAVASN